MYINCSKVTLRVTLTDVYAMFIQTSLISAITTRIVIPLGHKSHCRNEIIGWLNTRHQMRLRRVYIINSTDRFNAIKITNSNPVGSD